MSKIGNDLRAVEAWLLKLLKKIESDVVPAAVFITEHLKTALENGEVDFAATIVNDLAGRQIIQPEYIAIAKNILPKFLASELLIKDLITNPTADAVEAVKNDVINSYGLNSQKDKFYATFAAQVTTEILALKGQTITWSKAIAEGQTIYNDFQLDKAAYLD